MEVSDLGSTGLEMLFEGTRHGGKVCGEVQGGLAVDFCHILAPGLSHSRKRVAWMDYCLISAAHSVLHLSLHTLQE